MHAYVILLLLPLIGIVVFWLFPLALAIPVYLVILLVSGLMYWAIVRSMRRRTAFDEDGLTGSEATVISRFDSYGEAQYMVRVRGELWRADSRDELKPGETVRVLSVNGFVLLVERATAEHPSQRAERS